MVLGLVLPEPLRPVFWSLAPGWESARRARSASQQAPAATMVGSAQVLP